MSSVLLDPFSDADSRPGYARIQSEAALLRALRQPAARLIVQGHSLCRWALRLATARGWQVEEILSPAAELRAACPDLSRDQAKLILQRYGDQIEVAQRPLTLKRLTEAVFPVDLWRRLPNLHHASEWLLWLDETDPPECTLPIFSAWASSWHAASSGPEADIYQVTTAQAARGLLAAWLGYGTPDTPAPSARFPADVPARLLSAAASAWMPKIIESKGDFFDQLRSRDLPSALLESAAELAYGYYQRNQPHLTEARIRRLADYLQPSQVQELRRIIPPPIPQPLPAEPADVLAWFREQYLPYRQWAEQARDRSAREAANRLARAFGLWYLGYYPRAISTGDEQICFFRSAKTLSRNAGDVTLVVVLDGLHAADAALLVKRLAGLQRRLTITHNGLTFAPIPTVTEICKRAIVRGCPPRDVERQPVNPRVHSIPEGRDPTSTLADAPAGAVVVWTLAEPDKTYHGRADRATLLRQAAGEIATAAQRISDACQAVPPQIGVRVVLTTDHGRLLGDSERTQPVPAGMATHQRAAWGPMAPDTPYPASGFHVSESGAIVYFSGTRFGVSDTDNCAVVLNDGAFQMNDGRTGAEHFPHGGLFPEEVIIPWCELQRDVQPPAVRCKVVGKAREGREGTLTLEVINPSEIDLQLTMLTLVFGKRHPVELSLESSLPPLSQRTLILPLSPWPSRRDALAVQASARFRLPAAGEFSAQVEALLETEGFYSREDDILGELQ